MRLLRLAGIPAGGDVYDWLEAGGNADDLAQAAELADEYRPEPKGRLRPFCIHDLLVLDIPPREMLLDPIIPEKGLAMVDATRGTGKTHLACGSSYAVATGTTFLKWNAPTARRILHCDGEMAVRNPIDQTVKRFGRLDAAVNNAGTEAHPGPSRSRRQRAMPPCSARRSV